MRSNEVLDADVLQADGVQHAGGGLDDARGGVAGHGLQRDALGDEAADPLQLDDLFKFDAVAKGAAGGDDWVDEVHPSHSTFMSGFTRGDPWKKQ